MITVTKQFSFCYGHHLPNYEGKCRAQHGHNSILEVEVSGARENMPVPEGMTVDFTDLKSIINSYIVDSLDHTHINHLAPIGDGICREASIAMINMPTAENMVLWIVSVLKPYFGIHLIRVRLSETPTSWAEWKK